MQILLTPAQALQKIPQRPDDTQPYGTAFGDTLIAAIGGGAFQCRAYLRRLYSPNGYPYHFCYRLASAGSGKNDSCHTSDIESAHAQTIAALQAFYDEKNREYEDFEREQEALKARREKKASA